MNVSPTLSRMDQVVAERRSLVLALPSSLPAERNYLHKRMELLGRQIEQLLDHSNRGGRFT